METALDILVFLLAGAAFPIGSILISRWLLAPRFPDAEKESTYESGELPFGDARVKFHIHYYIVALIFVVFDVETVFLYPWAVVFQDIDRVFALAEMVLFILTLVVGLVYAWKKKVLTWV